MPAAHIRGAVFFPAKQSRHYDHYHQHWTTEQEPLELKYEYGSVTDSMSRIKDTHTRVFVQLLQQLGGLVPK